LQDPLFTSTPSGTPDNEFSNWIKPCAAQLKTDRLKLHWSLKLMVMNELTNFSVILVFALCVSTKQIGSVNMISNRNVESAGNYVLPKSYMAANKQEVRTSKAKTIEDAIDNVVRSVHGGKFLKNVKIYLKDEKYIVVEGDVWGIVNNANFRGYAVGDKVKWTTLHKDYTGIIVDLKNDEACIIKKDSDQKIVEVEYKDLTTIGKK
jgi:hypothetical protein